ncbi:hypothetical protein JD292_05825 [Leucobacter sp. CSA2]|uniref:Uncharacterized protein n=1 Tax=Leucobacter edaphi TaxID=2796472 RepID=A0A934QE50_9MICO|nr:hypothetical protein [Leucobacter edaphi]MBK0421587.1 hypothetical protein [Leucobacter edaphi]
MSVDDGMPEPEVDYAAAFEEVDLLEEESSDGATEWAGSLLVGTPLELDVAVFAESREELEEGARGELEEVLSELGALLAAVPSGEAELSSVALRGDRLGVGYRDADTNDEFIAVFERHEVPGGPGWKFTGFGEIET